MRLVRRAEWGAQPPKYLPGPQAAHDGIVVHYTGAGRYARTDHARCAGLVRQIQVNHLAIADQSDIEYQALVCVHGYVFEGRVEGQRGGANGTKDANAHYSSVCALIGADDALTDALLDAIEAAAVWLQAGSTWLGHRDVVPTGCPGDKLYAWAKGKHPWRNGTPDPPPPPPVGACTVQVLAGDSYWGIARRVWGRADATLVAGLMAANGAKALKPGDLLIVPGVHA